MESRMPRKQRKELYNAPLHKRRKWLSSHLEEKLLLKYDKRSISVIKGDTVKVMRGNFKGHENKVARVDVRKRYLDIEGLTMSKADGNNPLMPCQTVRQGISDQAISARYTKLFLYSILF